MRAFRVVAVSTVLLALSLAAPGPAAQADDSPLVVEIVVSPSTVSLDSEGIWMTVHAEIPYRLVDGFSVTLEGIPVVYTKSDLRGDLVAKFDLDAVKAILSPGTATLRLAGATWDGDSFAGVDTIRVTARDVR